jgi:hypothetical protein
VRRPRRLAASISILKLLYTYTENKLNSDISNKSVNISINDNMNENFFRFFQTIPYEMVEAKKSSHATVPFIERSGHRVRHETVHKNN